MTGPGEAAGRGHLRAASADREHVVAALKTAFVQGRLTKDELEARVAAAFASRTYAELATLTADIPAGSAVPGSAAVSPAAARPPASPARTMAKAAGRAGVCLLAAVALVEAAVLAGNPLLILVGAFAVMAASGFIGYGIIDAWHEMRTRRRPPQRQGEGHQGPEGGRAAGPPACPGDRTDPTRADLRACQPERSRSSGRAVTVRPGLGPALLSHGS